MSVQPCFGKDAGRYELGKVGDGGEKEHGRARDDWIQEPASRHLGMRSWGGEWPRLDGSWAGFKGRWWWWTSRAIDAAALQGWWNAPRSPEPASMRLLRRFPSFQSFHEVESVD